MNFVSELSLINCIEFNTLRKDFAKQHQPLIRQLYFESGTMVFTLETPARK